MDHRRFHERVSDRRGVALPTEVCKKLRIEVGDTVIVDGAEGKVQLHPFGTSLAEFRALAATKVPPAVLADELRAERRAETERE